MTPESILAEFETFWAVYPKKRDKGEARKAWIQTIKVRPPLDQLIAAVERGKASVDWHKCDREGNVGSFIPYPASWLRAEGWDNDYDVCLCPIAPPKANGQDVKIDITPPSPEQVEKVRDMLKSVRLRRVA